MSNGFSARDMMRDLQSQNSTSAMGMIADLTGGNGSLRGLLGSGQPGLSTLLGGTSPEGDSSEYTMTGGPGQVSSTTRIAKAYRDTRLAAVASGATVPATGGGGGGGGRTDNPRDFQSQR